MEAMHPAALDIDDLLKRCRVERGRASGPGGQHRNKVETAITITHTPTRISASASERRSQEQNRTNAIFRLRIKLAIDHRQPVDPDAAPSDLWSSRCRGGAISVSPKHDDYPALLAEAMDVLAEHDWQPPSVTDLLGCTASQLIKLLKGDPGALRRVNECRASLGLGRLR